MEILHFEDLGDMSVVWVRVFTSSGSTGGRGGGDAKTIISPNTSDKTWVKNTVQTRVKNSQNMSQNMNQNMNQNTRQKYSQNIWVKNTFKNTVKLVLEGHLVQGTISYSVPVSPK